MRDTFEQRRIAGTDELVARFFLLCYPTTFSKHQKSAISGLRRT